jgi:hypothetical protein
MTRLGTAIASLSLLAGAGLAQDEAALMSRLRQIRYPPIAAAARVMGDVRLRSGSEGVVPISGPPLLVRAALVSLEGLGKFPERSATEVVFHFSLLETPVREVALTVKKGDAFDRLILRVLGFKTEKIIKEKECVTNMELTENRIDSARGQIEVWVDGRICPLVETSGVVTD